MTSKINYIDGYFHYSPVKLKSLDGQREADITNQVISMDIYESILSPIVKAEMVIYDPVDVLQTFPVIGEEYVEFEWKISNDGKVVKTKLIVVSIDQIAIDPSNRAKTYVLRLTSPELYYSQKQLVQKKYEKNSADIIKDLLKLLDTKKKLQNDSTKGIEDITLTHQKPFQAIDLIRRRAVSTKHKSSSFVFFENKDGYHLRTLESLFEIGKENIGDRIFFYDTNTQESVLQNNYRNVISYSHCNYATSIDTIQNGGLRNRVVSLDLLTGELKDHDYKNEEFKKIDKGGKELHGKKFTSDYGKDISTQYFIATDSSLPEYQMPEKIGQLQGFIQRIVSSLLHIHVWGDCETTVGDVIELRLPDATGMTKSKEAKLISGNYMIAKCRHMLTFGTARHYTQSFELIKGSYLGK